MIKKVNGLYKRAQSRKPVEAKMAEEDDLINYQLSNYKKVFGDYDESKHAVSLTNRGRDGNVITLYNEEENPEDKAEVEPGMYEFLMKDFEVFFEEWSLPERNEYIDINNGMDEFTDHITGFFDIEDKFREYDEPYTDSALLYGKPGTGKTFTIMHNVSELLKKHDVQCFYLPGHVRLEDAIKFGDDLKDHKKILIIEELEERGGEGVETLVNFLDGYTRWDNTYTIGTTNYPNHLPEKLVKRPGRFNKLIEAELPSSEDILSFFEAKGVEANKKLANFCEDNNMSYAHLQEITRLTKIKGKDLKEALGVLKDHNQRVENNFKKESERAGMGRNKSSGKSPEDILKTI